VKVLSRHLFLLILGALMILPHCGKKAPPSLLPGVFPARVENLTGHRANASIVLTGRIAPTALPEEAFKGCRVYAAQYSLADSPCADCPIAYQGYRRFGPEVLQGEEFLCEMPLKKAGQIYFFEVRLLGPEGTMGPSSDRVTVIVEEAVVQD
jgi:hypothetical protein